ncbi:AP2 domain transcription factor AP2IX-7, putative [Babesia ovata]|uniref:AP2 domain transcription factor AP2IX-7, putative n=1 Tax=Babesia ovata TaxID=189622 RepID=A0A2H6KCJ1_9APIC|nr:AP2 domain transcription factor AP2IX-7, putative [Babesia ovata]GBE60694.1 AP2 domain transcription factor AP2IX-7, putative [Babesia ovata]
MAFGTLESSAGRDFKSHCQRMLSMSEDCKEVGDSDCGTSDCSFLNNHSYKGRNFSGNYASDSASVKLPDAGEAPTPIPVTATTHGREPPKTAKTKSVRDLECEECLRRLHSLAVGDNVYFRRTVLGLCEESDSSEFGNYVEGKVTCFSYDFMRRYIIVTLDGYGCLKFTFGDLHAMAVDRNVYLQRLQQSGILTKAQRQKRQRSYYEDEYVTRRSFSNHMATEESEDHTHDSAYASSHIAHSESGAAAAADSQGTRTRPVPPGAETICRCRFINKVDLVQKLRSTINQNKQEFYEKTESMQELRLIMSQNVRAYELEMVAYLLGEDPWAYSSNQYDRPTDEQIKEIVEQYGAAARNADYLAHFANWQKFQKQVKSEAKGVPNSAAGSSAP